MCTVIAVQGKERSTVVEVEWSQVILNSIIGCLQTLMVIGQVEAKLLGLILKEIGIHFTQNSIFL